jgi:hypothetical protein
MSKGHSIHAQMALGELFDAYFINKFIRSDASHIDSTCPPGHSNHRYNATMESYLGRLQVCHSADVLNSYCQSILGEILKRDAGTHEMVEKFFLREKPAELSERLFLHKASDHGARRALRDGMQTYWSPESDVIVTLRNKFVHQNGYDPERAVEAEIRSKEDQWCIIPPTDVQTGAIPVHYSEDHWLESNIELGTWACAHVRAHIDFMDQDLCTRFDLPRNLWRPRSVKRQYGSMSPSIRPSIQQTESPPKTSDFAKDSENVALKPQVRHSSQPAMTTSPSQKEIQCAQFMRETLRSFAQMGIEYAKKINARLIGADSGSYGILLNHTIQGHDLGYEMELKPSESDDGKSEFICFRVRESDFEPFLTIWGTSSQMKDFPRDDIPENAKRYLEECIDKTFTGSRH